MYDKHHFTRDGAHVRFNADASGITVDEAGEPTFDWDDISTVTVDNPPYTQAFETDEFYDIPATVAKPIPQPYQYSDDTTWLKKPREELKKGAWSLDNAPWTLGHPDTGMVKDVDDVKGFWANPRYVDASDDLDANLRVPVNDSEAKEFLQENGDVSVGFYNKIARTDEYDGVVGGADGDDIDIEGYQTNMLFDHCASVEVGRCPGEAGCGIDADMKSHGHVDTIDAETFKRGTRTTDINDESESTGDATTSIMAENTDAPSGIHVVDGQWFAVGPDEHPDESTDHAGDAKFPVNTCEDVTDAWNLRGTGDIGIEQSTLEERIKRVAEAKGCDLPDTASMDTPDVTAVAESAKRYSVCGSRLGEIDADSTVDCGCEPDTSDTNSNIDMDFEFDDLSTDATLAKVASQHDGVAERLETLRDAEETASVARDAVDELDIDDVSELADTVALIKERNDDLSETVEELQRPQMESDAEYIAEHTDRFGDDADEVIDSLDADAETIADKRELVEELASEYDEQTANSGGESSDASDSTSTQKYAKTPW